MRTPQTDYTKPLGLDVGTSRIVVARDTGKRYEYEAQLNAFLTLPYSRLAENLLQREGVLHEVEGAEIVVTGNDAQKFAEVFHVETRRPMRRGVINPDEPHSLAVLRHIISKKIFQDVYVSMDGDKRSMRFPPRRVPLGELDRRAPIGRAWSA